MTKEPDRIEQQRSIDQAIANAMIASTPEEWKDIVLELRRDAGNGNAAVLTHSLFSPEGFPSVEPEEDLYEATARPEQLMLQHGSVLTRAMYRATFAEGNWRCEASFEYAK